LFSQEVILEQGRAIAYTFEYMHSKNIIHSNVKPGNIFIETNGRWVLGDYGSTAKIGEKVHSFTQNYTHRDFVVAKRGIDWYMLTSTLMECLVGFESFSNNSRVDDKKLREQVKNIDYTELKEFLEGLLSKFDSNE
jgi:serine/threonine protein kinase